MTAGGDVLGTPWECVVCGWGGTPPLFFRRCECVIGELIFFSLGIPSPTHIPHAQVQLAQASPQSVHQKYEEMLRGVREKANFASLQLVTASHKAEQSIR